MPSAYERLPVDWRVRKRLRTGSGGTSEPGRAGQNRANRRIDGFLTKLPVQILRFFRSELALLSGENAILVRKKVPISVRHLADTFSAKIGPSPVLLERSYCQRAEKGALFVRSLPGFVFAPSAVFKSPHLNLGFGGACLLKVPEVPGTLVLVRKKVPIAVRHLGRLSSNVTEVPGTLVLVRNKVRIAVRHLAE